MIDDFVTQEHSNRVNEVVCHFCHTCLPNNLNVIDEDKGQGQPRWLITTHQPTIVLEVSVVGSDSCST